jgi:hypothetical protein
VSGAPTAGRSRFDRLGASAPMLWLLLIELTAHNGSPHLRKRPFWAVTSASERRRTEPDPINPAALRTTAFVDLPASKRTY